MSWETALLKGCLNLLSGMRRLLTEASLRAVLWRIVLLLLLLMLAIGFGVFALAEYMAELWLPEGGAWYWQALDSVVWFLSVLLALFTGAISFTVLGAVATAPWLDMLAERVEILQSGASLCEQERGVMRILMQSMSNAVRPLFGLLLMGALALTVIWLPLVGQMTAMLIWGYAGIRFLNFELIDVPASRHSWDFSRRKAAFKRQRFYWLGFGGLAMALMWVPLVNLLVLPAAVVAVSDQMSTQD